MKLSNFNFGFKKKPNPEQVVRSTVSTSEGLDIEGTQKCIDIINNEADGARKVVSNILKIIQKSNEEIVVYNCLLLVEKLMGCSEELVGYVESEQFQRVFKTIPSRFPQDGVAHAKTLSLTEKWALAYSPVISLYPNFQRTYQYLLVEQPNSPIAIEELGDIKQEEEPPKKEEKPVQQVEVKQDMNAIPATINGKLASWYLDKLQNDFLVVLQKSCEIKIRLESSLGISQDDALWAELSSDHTFICRCRGRLQELAPEVMDNAPIVEVLFQLTETIHNLGKWYECAKSGILYEGNQDIDTNRITILIDNIQPRGDGKMKQMNSIPSVNLSAPQANPVLRQSSSIKTPTDDLTEAFDIDDSEMVVPEPLSNRTPFNSLNEPKPPPQLRDNDIFAGLDIIKRSPDVVLEQKPAIPSILPGAPLTPANSFANDKPSTIPSILPDSRLKAIKQPAPTLTPASSLVTDPGLSPTPNSNLLLDSQVVNASPPTPFNSIRTTNSGSLSQDVPVSPSMPESAMFLQATTSESQSDLPGIPTTPVTEEKISESVQAKEPEQAEPATTQVTASIQQESQPETAATQIPESAKQDEEESSGP